MYKYLGGLLFFSVWCKFMLLFELKLLLWLDCMMVM